MTALEKAVYAMLDACEEALLDNAHHFSCSEAEAIADLIREAQDDASAEQFLLAHAADDDEGDAHFVGPAQP